MAKSKDKNTSSLSRESQLKLLQAIENEMASANNEEPLRKPINELDVYSVFSPVYLKNEDPIQSFIYDVHKGIYGTADFERKYGNILNEKLTSKNIKDLYSELNLPKGITLSTRTFPEKIKTLEDHINFLNKLNVIPKGSKYTTFADKLFGKDTGIDNSDIGDNKDIEALNNYWKVYPSLKNSLFKANERAGFWDLNVAKDEIKSTMKNSNIGMIIIDSINKYFRVEQARIETSFFNSHNHSNNNYVFLWVFCS